MGTANISGLDKLFLQVPAAGESGNAGKEGGGINFSRVMSQMTALAGENLAFGSSSGQLSQEAVKGSASVSGSEYDRYRYRENEIQKQPGEKTPEAERVTEKLASFEKDVREILKEELGVTDEQIEEAMKTLGLTVADLLNPNQLAALVSELTGAADMGALLCDSGFLNVMQEIGTLGKVMLEELGMTKEQLVEFVLMTEEPVTDQQNTGLDGTEVELPAEETEESVPTVEISDHRTDRAQETVKPDGSAEELQENQKDGSAEKTETVERSADAEESGREAGRQEAGREQTGAGVTAGIQNSVDALTPQQTESMNEFSARLDTANIIRQIVEHVRVNLSNTATTLEMQLNPENLGKLYLQLTAKDGMVSARIMAQNEMVRAALENQVAELRENMEHSGIRVDAVEVTVGSHEFEKNLEQNARQQEREAEEQEKSAKRNRRINLNDLDELSGVMTEEESLVAQMMAEQGNSIDFSA